MESGRGSRLSLRKKKPLSRSCKPPSTSLHSSGAGTDFTATSLSAQSTSQVDIPKIQSHPPPNTGEEEEKDFKMPRKEIPKLNSEECLLSTIEEEQLQLAQALSASVERGENVHAPPPVVDNRKRKRKRGGNSTRPPSPLLVLTTTPDEAQQLLQERAEQMITEETREEEFSCTPVFTISSRDSADVGVATVREKEEEEMDITEYKTLWELSRCSQEKDEFYVPALSQFITRPSPPRAALPGVVGTCTGSLDGLSNALLTLVDCPSSSDLTVVTKGGKKIHAHSAILGCRCPRMKEVLESSPNVLDLSAFSHSSVMTLLVFLYSAIAPIGLGDEERRDLVTQAEIWGVEELTKICNDQCFQENENDTLPLPPLPTSPSVSPAPLLSPPSPLLKSPLPPPSPPLKSPSLPPLYSPSQFPSPYSISSSSLSPSQPPTTQPPSSQPPLSQPPPSQPLPSQTPQLRPQAVKSLLLHSLPSQPQSPSSQLSQSPLPSPELQPSPPSAMLSPLPPAVITEMVEAMVTPANQQIPLESGDTITPMVTPANQQIPPESGDTITPMPDYQTMATPHLKRQCVGFGVRAMPKKRMIAKLEEIYDYTHPLANEQDTAEKEVENKKGEDGCGKKQSKRAAKLLDSGTQERDVIQAIVSDTKLYNDLLLYKPLQLSDLQLRLKSASIPVSISKEKLTDTLDQLCVTFTTPHERPYS